MYTGTKVSLESSEPIVASPLDLPGRQWQTPTVLVVTVLSPTPGSDCSISFAGTVKRGQIDLLSNLPTEPSEGLGSRALSGDEAEFESADPNTSGEGPGTAQAPGSTPARSYMEVVPRWDQQSKTKHATSTPEALISPCFGM